MARGRQQSLTPASPLEDWEHEGPEDPAGDESLLAEALTMIQQYDENPDDWRTLEEFEAELAEAGSLPRA